MFKKDLKYVKILNLYINSTSKERLLSFVRGNIIRSRKFSMFTPNPEICLRAFQDPKYARILNSSYFSLADGIGLSLAYNFLSLPRSKFKFLNIFLFFFEGILVALSLFFIRNWLFGKVRPIKGRKFFLDLISLANKESWKVFLLGGMGDEAKISCEILTKSFKKVKIEYAKGPILDNKACPVSAIDKVIEKNVIEKINKFQPELLFVGFGAPKQEIWIDKWLPKLEAKGIMAVGGTFEYISRKVSLPPSGLSKFGLEWLWRFITQPKRIKRIINAIIIFPITVFLYKLNSPSK